MHNLSETYVNAMKVGFLFNQSGYLNDSRTQEWNCSEECSEFTKTILEYAKENNQSVDHTFQLLHEDLVIRINKHHSNESHLWDDYCKGFLAGQIIGNPNETNLTLANQADLMWNEDGGEQYGYYQEVLEVVKHPSIEMEKTIRTIWYGKIVTAKIGMMDYHGGSAEIYNSDGKCVESDLDILKWDFYEYSDDPLLFIELPDLKEKNVVSLIRQVEEWYGDTEHETPEWALEFELFVRMVVTDQEKYLFCNPRYLELTDDHLKRLIDIIRA